MLQLFGVNINIGHTVMKYAFIWVLLSLGGCVFAPKPITTHEGYVKALDRHVSKNLVMPEKYVQTNVCNVNVEQDQDGNVTSVKYGDCDEDVTLINAIDTALANSSPLPLPDDMSLFENDLLFRFCRDCDE